MTSKSINAYVQTFQCQDEYIFSRTSEHDAEAEKYNLVIKMVSSDIIFVWNFVNSLEYS